MPKVELTRDRARARTPNHGKVALKSATMPCPPAPRQRRNIHPSNFAHRTRISPSCVWALRDMDDLYDMPIGTAANIALAIGLQHMLKASKLNYNPPQDVQDAIKFHVDNFARYCATQR
jgi:hypothetical protein